MQKTLWGALAVCLMGGVAHAEKAFERRLYTDRVEASSFEWGDWNRFQENYHPNYVADGDPKTAWTEGAKGPGAGEWLRVHLTPLKDAKRLRLRIQNGYHKSKRLFSRNARAKEVTVKLLPSGVEKRVTLADSRKWLSIKVDQPAGPLTGYEIKVKSVYKGTHYEDLCISEIQTFVTASTRDNPSFEKSKRARLLAWKRKRTDSAKLFKAQAGKSIPVAPQYKLTKGAPVENHQAQCGYDKSCFRTYVARVAKKRWPERNTHLKLVEAGFNNKFADWQRVRLSTIDTRPLPEVDGFHVPQVWSDWPEEQTFDWPIPGQMGYLRSTHLRSVTAKGGPAPAKAMEGKAKACRSDDPKTFAWTPPSYEKASMHLRALLVVVCGTVEERDGEYQTASWQVLFYDHDGQLEFTVGEQYATAFAWQTVAGQARVAGATRLAITGLPEQTLTAL